MQPAEQDFRTREGRAVQASEGGIVVVDKADKSGSTFAVVWYGDLLPVRFGSLDDAWKHVADLREAA